MAKLDEDTEALDIIDSCEAMGAADVDDSEEAVVLDSDDDDVASFGGRNISGSDCKRWHFGYIRRGVYAVCGPATSGNDFAAVKASENLSSLASSSIHTYPFSQKHGIKDEFSSEQEVVEAVPIQDSLGCNGHINNLDNKTKKIQGLRKLYTRNMLLENNLSGNTCKASDDVKGSMICSSAGQETVKLGDTESQEYKNLSQADALGFVDHYLSLNGMHFLEKDAPGKTGRLKSPPLSRAKGPKKLARRTSSGSLCDLSQAFEWEDDHIHTVEAKLDNSKPRSVTKHYRNQKSLGCTEFPNPVEENYKAVNEVDQVSETNCFKEMNDELNVERSLQVEAGDIIVNVPDACDVGFDTQMAAEAMEALSYAPPSNFIVDLAHQDSGIIIGNSSVSKEAHSDSGLAVRKFKQKNQISKKSYGQRSRFVEMGMEELDSELPESKGREKKTQGKSYTKIDSNSLCTINVRVCSCKSSDNLTEQGKDAKSLGRDLINKDDEDINPLTSGEPNSRGQVRPRSKKRNLSSVVHLRRQSSTARRMEDSKDHLSSSSEGMNGDVELGVLKRKKNNENAEVFQLLTARRKRSNTCALTSGKVGNAKASQKQQKYVILEPVGCHSKFDEWSFPKGKRKHRKARRQLNLLSFLLRPPLVEGGTGPSSSIGCPIEENSRSSCLKVYVRRKSRPLVDNHQLVLNSVEYSIKRNSEVQSSSVLHRGFSAANEEMTVPSQDNFEAFRLSSSVDSVDPTLPPTGANKPLEKPQNVNLALSGRENQHQLCNRRCKRVPLVKELFNLEISDSELNNESKPSRRRKDMKTVRVLFSQNMDDTIIKKQKKILGSLGSFIVSSCSEATHFVADRFVRTRNMLEAIALGKPVVTHLWLVSCGQANFYVDEKNYVLRDAKKEREIGFSMPVSLANARKAPLLKSRRVFVTPNIKPGKELIVSLVKAVQGEVWSEAEDRFHEAFKKKMISDDFLILSCNQDYAFCAPFLEQGAAIYSSEFLLNGIIIQKLEFERHRLF